MARAKRKSRILNWATGRLSALKKIDPDLDLGRGMTVSAFKAKAVGLADALMEYNGLLARTDAQRSRVLHLERELSDMTTRFLRGVGSRYGLDSPQYAMAGGTRRSDRKRWRRKK